MKTIFIINLLLIGFSLSVLPQVVKGDFPKSLFSDMQLVTKQKKQVHLKNELRSELLNYSFSLPDTIISVKEKKLTCFKNTKYYEFEAIIKDTACLYLMVNKNGDYSLLEGTSVDEDYLFYKIGFPTLSTEEQIVEYLKLYTDLQYVESSWELSSSRFRMINDINNEIITKVKNKDLGFPATPKLIGEINNEYQIQLCLSFDGGIYKVVYSLSKEGDVNMDDEDVILVAHYDYRDRFENGKIVKYSELDFYQPAAIKLENVFKKDVQFTQLNYINKKVEFFELKDSLTFTLIDLSKLDWKPTKDSTISENYMAEFHFEIADSLQGNESFVFLAINTNKWELLSPGNRIIRPVFPAIKIDKNKYTLNLDNQIESGEYSIRIYNQIIQIAPIYIAFCAFSASDTDTNQLLRILIDLQKQTNK